MEVSDEAKERMLDEEIAVIMHLLAVVYPPGCNDVISLPVIPDMIKKSKNRLTLHLCIVKIFKLIDKRKVDMAKETHLCKSCGKSVKPVTVTPGSFFIELLLWLLMLLPGFIYSIWRLTARHKACPACKSKDIIPIGSPLALNSGKEDKKEIGIPEQIEKLSVLKDKGILTESEFNLKKLELLAKI